MTEAVQQHAIAGSNPKKSGRIARIFEEHDGASLAGDPDAMPTWIH